MTERTTIPLQDVWRYDGRFREALEQIRRCTDVALLQGPLSRRNALGEIADIARTATTQAHGESADAAKEG